MKTYLAVLLSFLGFTISVSGQTVIPSLDPLKTITLLKNNTYDIKEITEDSLLIYKGKLISVEPEIRQGKFYFFNNAGRVVVTGQYYQDIPTGEWVYYDENNDTIRSINYSEVWEYLETDALDYEIDTLVLQKLKRRRKQHMNPDGTFYIVEKMPRFNGGDPAVEFHKYVKENLIYPIYAARKEITGTVRVQFMVDHDGYIRNPVVIDPVYPDLNIEAIRVLKDAPKWEPGRQGKYPGGCVLYMAN